MRSGAWLPTRRSRLAAALLAALVGIPGVGLTLLGLGAADLGEARARLRVQDGLGAAGLALTAATLSLLREADLAAESREEGSPLVDGIFLTDAAGAVLLPERTVFPALPPPAPEDAGAVRKILAAADTEEAAGGDPTGAALLPEGALADFAHPDLVATLADAAADLYLRGGRPDRALYLSREIVTSFPSARDPEGLPLAPGAYLRILRILTEAEDVEASRQTALGFAEHLADGAWPLPRHERDLMLERAAAALTPGALPEEIVERARLLDALAARIVPEAGDLLAAGSEAGWRHLVRQADLGPEVYGYRILVLGERPHFFGYRLDGGELSRRLAAIAESISGEQGILVEIGLLPVLARGGTPGPDAIVRRTDLGGDLRGIVARFSAPPPDDFAALRAVTAGLAGLFALSLFVGLLLSVRAVRREIETARIRQHLLDNVSHELRTPLTTIRMYAEMLADETDLPEAKRAEGLGWVLRESERLSRLVEDVLDLSRLSRGEARLARETVDPADVAAEAAEKLRPLAEKRGCPLAVAVPVSLPPVRVDRDATVRVLVNLLANAVRYSGDGGEVRLEGLREGGTVRLTVADRGPGIEEAARAHLFDRFYRAPRDAGRVKGAGLGLALAREIARAQGGDVTLLETSPGGSTFALTLPVAGDSP